MNMLTVYNKLLQQFGSRGWWPAGRSFRPKEWEICLGAILTQNTNWKNVEYALDNLKEKGILSPQDILNTDLRKLQSLVRPSGYYKQKTQRLKTLAGFVLGFGDFENFRKNVTRNQLLAIKGIGFETADSILLYACGRPYFVIDSYTRRFAKSLGIKAKDDYESLREYFEKSLPKDVEIYREFHALIVEWGKSKPTDTIK